MRLVGHKLKKKAHENAAPLRPLLGLAFASIMNRNEYSVIEKNVIFKTFHEYLKHCGLHEGRV